MPDATQREKAAVAVLIWCEIGGMAGGFLLHPHPPAWTEATTAAPAWGAGGFGPGPTARCDVM